MKLHSLKAMARVSLHVVGDIAITI